jgi:hypothetical protein
MKFITHTPGVRLEVRSPGVPVREIELGETVELGAVAGVEIVSVPADAAPTIDGLVVTPHALGLHHFRVDGVAGERCDFYLFAYEPGCLARVPVRQSHGRCGEDRIPAERRLVIRSLVQHHNSDARWFDGSATSMIGRALLPFGA